MDCPKDADRVFKGETCKAEKEVNGKVYRCTRERGHTDNHHCHRAGICLLEWSSTEERLFFAEGDVIDIYLIEGIIRRIRDSFISVSGNGLVRCRKDLTVVVRY